MSGSFKGGNSSNLYLITFLATLFLLLFISCAIVLRSYYLRRRFQRQLDEAVAAGYLLPPRPQASHKRRFGPKPKVHHAWIAHGGTKWCEMMPVSALPVQLKRRSKNETQQIPPSSQLPSIPEPEQPSSLRHKFFRALRDHHQPNPGSPSAAELEKPVRPKIDMLQVSVIISMPSPDRPVNCSTSTLGKVDEDEDGIPELVFGVSRLPYKPPAAVLPTVN